MVLGLGTPRVNQPDGSPSEFSGGAHLQPVLSWRCNLA